MQQRFPSPAYVPACSPLNATVLLLSLSPGLRGHGGRHAGRAGPPAAPRLPVRAGPPGCQVKEALWQQLTCLLQGLALGHTLVLVQVS